MADAMVGSPKITLPVLALRQLVIFPGVTLPILAGRPRTLRAVEAAMKAPGDRKSLVFAVLQRGNSDEITPGGLHTIGTIARIDQIQSGLGGAQLLVTGQRRGLALRIQDQGGYLQATVGDAEELQAHEDDLAFVALHREARQRVLELAQKTGLPAEVTERVLSTVEDAGRFSDLVASYLEVDPAERQTLLECLAIEDRLRKVLTLVQRQLNVLKAQEDIKSQVQEEIGDRQREMYLREQLKAIQRELGEDDSHSDELAELRGKIDKLDLPEKALKEVERELVRLERMPREAMEAQVIRNFVETVAELPWNHKSEDRLDLPAAADILDEDHYGLAEVKDRILEFLAVRQMRGRRAQAVSELPAQETAEEDGSTADQAPVQQAKARGRSPILLFTGPPGVGKTSLAKSIARAMGREYVRVSLGGVRDEADIRGHRRTYVGAMPGRILQGMRQAGTKNPVFLLDEVDKVGASHHGDPAAALLEVLDPAQNDTFTDHYLGLEFDLSEVFFIATANFLQNIPQPLLDRMEVVEFAGYTEAEKLEIARRYLLPKQLEEGGLDLHQLFLEDGAIQTLVSGYTREAGVRQLERELGRVVRKVARQLAEQPEEQAATRHLGGDDVAPLLGRPRVHPEIAAKSDQVGIATGMYYTPVGGDIMFVETTSMPGKGELVLTGQLGDVMKESARAALSYARSHASGLRIDPETFERDIHIHVPAGAIPKDGPSAGVTMATALVSALSSRPARHDLAMTGEITLSGRVLPIGGVKEKVLGAVRAGITHILLPADNERDLEDLPAEIQKQVTFTFASELGQVLAVALRNASYQDGRLLFKGDRPEDIKHLASLN